MMLDQMQNQARSLAVILLGMLMLLSLPLAILFSLRWLGAPVAICLESYIGTALMLIVLRLIFTKVK